MFIGYSCHSEKSIVTWDDGTLIGERVFNFTTYISEQEMLTLQKECVFEITGSPSLEAVVLKYVGQTIECGNDYSMTIKALEAASALEGTSLSAFSKALFAAGLII